VDSDKAHSQTGGGDDDEEDEDVEHSIQKELADMDNSAKGKGSKALFTPVRTNIDCLIFLKTRAPVEPVPFVHRVCENARTAGHKGRRTRYVNRLSPNVLFGKATEAGLLETARTVLGGTFDLSGKRVVDKMVEGGESGEKPKKGATPEPEPAEGEKAPQPNAGPEKKGFSVSGPGIQTTRVQELT
jgi:tRNA acetyltransferase TAN1